MFSFEGPLPNKMDIYKPPGLRNTALGYIASYTADSMINTHAGSLAGTHVKVKVVTGSYRFLPMIAYIRVQHINENII